MISFCIALVSLILGYIFYSRIIDAVFKPTDEPTPAITKADGVDFVAMPTWKVFLIQLLNIAGLGPIFGALGGALWGSSVYIWIVLGTIFAGGVHDYLSGMMSVREGGKNISEIVGEHMGKNVLTIMRVFIVILMILVGTVFTSGPAMLLTKLSGISLSTWLLIILTYYFLATLLPIDKLIGRLYPIFGACFIFMAVGIMFGMLFGIGGHVMPEVTLSNMYPSENPLPIWSLMFITVACGAISGFHSTQSPMMARCLNNEHLARPVFYGAMVTEGIIALIWAAAGVTFYDGTGGLMNVMNSDGPGGVVYEISVGFLGAGVGSIIAMLGVIICPISSGDTAFRVARLTLADWFNISQLKLKQRISLAVPILLIAGILTQIDFSIIWRYFSWTNQTLAMIVLWTGTVYIYNRNPESNAYLVSLIPALFMSVSTSTYIFQADEGFKLSAEISTVIGVILSMIYFGLFWKYTSRVKLKIQTE